MKKTIGLSIAFALFIWPLFSQAVTLPNTYPHLANYFLKWEISDQEAQELSKSSSLTTNLNFDRINKGQGRIRAQ